MVLQCQLKYVNYVFFCFGGKEKGNASRGERNFIKIPLIFIKEINIYIYI